MTQSRSSGILLHPTSLPSTLGIGTIGAPAYRFVDWLETANQTLWQVLPIGPTGYGDSPYASFSTFAGNPLLIDLDLLQKDGYLSAEDLAAPDWVKRTGYVDYSAVVYWKIPVLKRAALSFLQQLHADANAQEAQYRAFVKEHEYWLTDYALFMSIKDVYDKKAQDEKKSGAMWSNYWPQELATHNGATLKEWESAHQSDCDVYKVIQFFFFTQWKQLKAYANGKNISIIGDIPIFVAPDSADVWANQRFFQLDKTGKATAVAGVPPDYFSATGQLWGNPLYNWDALKADGYAWWVSRIRAMLTLVDFVRIDHFRGFESYWAVPAGEETAINGEWVKGPDHDLFNTIQQKLGNIPIIAEDLGLITDEVQALRDDFALPGMKILQFAFDTTEKARGGYTNPFLPHMYASANCVVYTGTHDNSTMAGWLKSIPREQLALVKQYLATTTEDIPTLCDAMIRLALGSVAKLAVIPLQDLFAVDDEGRMNTPSTTGGHNWQWRMSEEHFCPKTAAKLKEWGILYGRNLPQPQEEA